MPSGSEFNGSFPQSPPMTPPRAFSCVVLLLTFFACLPKPGLLAQDALPQTAQVEGVVRDLNGRPIPGVSVILQQPGAADRRIAKTDSDGLFAVFALPAGNYDIKVEKGAFGTATSKSFSLAPAEKKHCEFVLRSGQSTDSSLSGIELDDKPNFTVAGLSDLTGSGGHGSETRMRTGDVLAKETVELEPRKAESADKLLQARAQIEKKLAGREPLPVREEGDLHRELGDIDEKLNDPLAAEREYENATGADPSERNYFIWGAELLLHGAYAPAVEVFGKGSRLHPDSSRMLAGLGAALYANGSAEDAAKRLCEASDLDPGNAAPYQFLGKMQESTTTALPCIEERLARFVSNQPSLALANYYYALALWKGERGAETVHNSGQVERLLEKAAALDPRFDPAYLQLGNLRFERGDSTGAIAAYKKALAENPSSSETHYRLGLVYERVGDRAKGRSELEIYKKLDRDEASTIGRQRRELGQFLFVFKTPSRSPAAVQDSLAPSGPK